MPMDVTLDGQDLDDIEDIELDGFEMMEEEYPEDSDLDGDDAEDHESRFFTCHVCGDNWLSVREDSEDATCHITFIHQMGMAPVLKRVAHVESQIVINEGSVDHWEYFLDDEQVDEKIWLEKLTRRRKVLKSVCTN